MFEKVRSIVCDQLGFSEDEVTMDSNFFTDLGADSLDLMELLVFSESEFKITIEEDQMKSFKTVGDVVRYIESRA